jgi:hypothetical protein
MRAIANQQVQTGRLSYYASLLPGKESQFQTPEGYRIYKNVRKGKSPTRSAPYKGDFLTRRRRPTLGFQEAQ